MPELPPSAPGPSAINLHLFDCRCQSQEATPRSPPRWPSANLGTRALRKPSGEISAGWHCTDLDITGSAPPVAPSESMKPGSSRCRPALAGQRGPEAPASGLLRLQWQGPAKSRGMAPAQRDPPVSR